MSRVGRFDCRSGSRRGWFGGYWRTRWVTEETSRLSPISVFAVFAAERNARRATHTSSLAARWVSGSGTESGFSMNLAYEWSATAADTRCDTSHHVGPRDSEPVSITVERSFSAVRGMTAPRLSYLK
jgi:hypothetical protein